MSIHTLLAPQDIELGRTVLHWAENYLMKDHAEIKRPYGSQVVCPFVEPSVKANSFYMAFHKEINGQDVRSMADVILSYIEPFKNAPPYDANQQRQKALLIVFPSVEKSSLRCLDVCHEIIKPKMVEVGLMVGQFHPRCQEAAVHNPDWREVSKSPVPLIAMRNMAVHDVMFLANDKEWFKTYNVRFGDYFRDRANIPEHDRHLIKYYETARSKFSR
jgi:hypothetical protein